jgi:hypothetical protein
MCILALIWLYTTLNTAEPTTSAMNQELEKIIDFYEEEQQRLENLIQLAVEETEYKVAHYHQKVLAKVNAKLNCLKNLETPNFDRIEWLARAKRTYEEMIASKNNPIDYLEQEIKRMDGELDSLRNLNKVPSIDGQEFDDLIFDMAEGQISKFRFFWGRMDEDLYLDFEKMENQIVISIPGYKELRKNYTFTKSSTRTLKSLGFKKTEDKKSMVLYFDLNGFRDAIAIKTLTSRILYDAIGYSHLNQATILQIIA